MAPHRNPPIRGRDLPRGESVLDSSFAGSSPSPTPDRDGSTYTRRELLAGAVGATGAAVLGGGVIRRLAAQEAALSRVSQAMDTTTRQGRPPSAVGTRAEYENPERTASANSSGTPHEDLHGIITPSDLHYERHHAGIPDIDPTQYALLVHGMVERPTVFTLDDLKSFPSTSAIRFLECSGNYRVNAAEETRPGRVAPLTSTSEWTGVPLSVLFREVGASLEATWFLAEGQDAAVLTRSIPIEKAFDDAMIAYGQNGEALRPEQGYPARLFNPGWEGNSSVKWLRRIELSDRPFMTREETSKYTEPIGEGRSRQFSFVMDARSLITSPGYPEIVRPGWIEIRGIAWSGRGRVARVEISLDDRRTWVDADLQAPVLSKAHTRFRYLWNWDGRETAIWSRAVDETGYVQPSQEEWIAARTTASGPYHRNPTTGWRVGSDGSVVYRQQEWTS